MICFAVAAAAFCMSIIHDPSFHLLLQHQLEQPISPTSKQNLKCYKSPLQLHLCEVVVVKLLGWNFTELPEGHGEVRLRVLHHLEKQTQIRLVVKKNIHFVHSQQTDSEIRLIYETEI